MFESQGERSFRTLSPGGFEFGAQGWTWGDPIPKSITFFLDNTAAVCDQYGRYVRAARMENGAEVLFADKPPDASQDGRVVGRPHFATHKQVIETLKSEGVDWLAYEVRQLTSNGVKVKGRLTRAQAQEMQTKLIREGAKEVKMDRSVSCAGWPQLTYEELKKLPEVPMTPAEELRKIADPKLRKDAIRLRQEADAQYNVQELEEATEEAKAQYV